ncbi:MAG: NADH-specific enoyl-ACP reductase [Planctomycetota bacterium]|nr:MAG: NADH-specific enoyl-ACP reductase [Planctomycetota bacterium]
MLLAGKTGVVLGVANKRSIAYACAAAASREGAKLILTYQNDRVAAGVRALSEGLPGEALAIECDVSNDEGLAATAAAIGEHMPQVDFVIHSVAFAKRDELEGRFIDTSREGWRTALDISAYSLAAVTRNLAPLMTSGGSIVTMSYLGGERVMPHYNVMGPAKAALESSVRYLAADLGPEGVRVNAISAGPIRTLAASGISGFAQMLDMAAERTPLRRNATQKDVADATLFLLSDMSRAVTGTTLYVDCGFHIMAV